MSWQVTYPGLSTSMDLTLGASGNYVPHLILLRVTAQCWGCFRLAASCFSNTSSNLELYFAQRNSVLPHLEMDKRAVCSKDCELVVVRGCLGVKPAAENGPISCSSEAADPL